MAAPKGHPAYPGCEKGGKPKKYTTEVVEKFADDLLEWYKIEKNIWFKDFCLENGLHPDYLRDWSSSNEKFRNAYDLAYLIQESKIFNGSLLNKLNTTMSKMALCNWHGWSDKTETKISGDPINPVILLYQEAINTSKDLVNDPVQE